MKKPTIETLEYLAKHHRELGFRQFYNAEKNFEASNQFLREAKALRKKLKGKKS